MVALNAQNDKHTSDLTVGQYAAHCSCRDTQVLLHATWLPHKGAEVLAGVKRIWYPNAKNCV